MGCPQIHLGWDQIRDHCRSGPQKLYWPQTVLMAPIRVCPKTGLRCVLHRYLFGWGQYDAIAYIGPPDYTSYYCRACCGQSSYYGRWAQSFRRIVETFILSSYWYLSLPATGNFRVTFYQSWTKKPIISIKQQDSNRQHYRLRVYRKAIQIKSFKLFYACVHTCTLQVKHTNLLNIHEIFS